MSGIARAIGNARARLALGGGSEDRKDMLMKIGLGVLVVAVVVAIVMGVATSGGGGERGNLLYICLDPACGHQFHLSVQEEDKSEKSRPRNDFEPPLLKCTKCGKLSAARGDVCPACNKEYVQHKAKVNAKGGPICPSCGVDIVQYMREHKE